MLSNLDSQDLVGLYVNASIKSSRLICLFLVRVASCLFCLGSAYGAQSVSNSRGAVDFCGGGVSDGLAGGIGGALSLQRRGCADCPIKPKLATSGATSLLLGRLVMVVTMPGACDCSPSMSFGRRLLLYLG